MLNSSEEFESKDRKVRFRYIRSRRSSINQSHEYAKALIEAIQ
jgi:hypothetical protein